MLSQDSGLNKVQTLNTRGLISLDILILSLNNGR